jgi:hypothetical protein
LSVDKVLSCIIHFKKNKLDTLLIDLNLGLSNHIVDKPNEGTKGVVVLTSKAKNACLKFILLLLKHHRLILVGLAHLSMVKVFLVTKTSALRNDLDKGLKLLENLVNLFIIVGLYASCSIVALGLLFVHELLKVIGLLIDLRYRESLHRSHLKQCLINI